MTGGFELPFIVHITDADRAYLDNLPLSDRAKGKVEDFIDYAIAQVDDASRLDPERRPWPNLPFFQTELLLMDSDTSGKKSFHKITFTVKDAAAPYGVLVIVLIDHE